MKLVALLLFVLLVGSHAGNASQKLKQRLRSRARSTLRDEPLPGDAPASAGIAGADTVKLPGVDISSDKDGVAPGSPPAPPTLDDAVKNSIDQVIAGAPPSTTVAANLAATDKPPGELPIPAPVAGDRPADVSDSAAAAPATPVGSVANAEPAKPEEHIPVPPPPPAELHANGAPVNVVNANEASTVTPASEPQAHPSAEVVPPTPKPADVAPPSPVAPVVPESRPTPEPEPVAAVTNTNNRPADTVSQNASPVPPATPAVEVNNNKPEAGVAPPAPTRTAAEAPKPLAENALPTPAKPQEEVPTTPKPEIAAVPAPIVPQAGEPAVVPKPADVEPKVEPALPKPENEANTVAAVTPKPEDNKPAEPTVNLPSTPVVPEAGQPETPAPVVPLAAEPKLPEEKPTDSSLAPTTTTSDTQPTPAVEVPKPEVPVPVALPPLPAIEPPKPAAADPAEPVAETKEKEKDANSPKPSEESTAAGEGDKNKPTAGAPEPSPSAPVPSTGSTTLATPQIPAANTPAEAPKSPEAELSVPKPGAAPGQEPTPVEKTPQAELQSVEKTIDQIKNSNIPNAEQMYGDTVKELKTEEVQLKQSTGEVPLPSAVDLAPPGSAPAPVGPVENKTAPPPKPDEADKDEDDSNPPDAKPKADSLQDSIKQALEVPGGAQLYNKQIKADTKELNVEQTSGTVQDAAPAAPVNPPSEQDKQHPAPPAQNGNKPSEPADTNPEFAQMDAGDRVKFLKDRLDDTEVIPNIDQAEVTKLRDQLKDAQQDAGGAGGDADDKDDDTPSTSTSTSSTSSDSSTPSTPSTPSPPPASTSSSSGDLTPFQRELQDLVKAKTAANQNAEQIVSLLTAMRDELVKRVDKLKEDTTNSVGNFEKQLNTLNQLKTSASNDKTATEALVDKLREALLALDARIKSVQADLAALSLVEIDSDDTPAHLRWASNQRRLEVLRKEHSAILAVVQHLVRVPARHLNQPVTALLEEHLTVLKEAGNGATTRFLEQALSEMREEDAPAAERHRQQLKDLREALAPLQDGMRKFESAMEKIVQADEAAANANNAGTTTTTDDDNSDDDSSAQPPQPVVKPAPVADDTPDNSPAPDSAPDDDDDDDNSPPTQPTPAAVAENKPVAPSTPSDTDSDDDNTPPAQPQPAAPKPVADNDGGDDNDAPTPNPTDVAKAADDAVRIAGLTQQLVALGQDRSLKQQELDAAIQASNVLGNREAELNRQYQSLQGIVDALKVNAQTDIERITRQVADINAVIQSLSAVARGSFVQVESGSAKGVLHKLRSRVSTAKWN